MLDVRILTKSIWNKMTVIQRTSFLKDSGYSIQDKTKLWFELDTMEQEDLIKLTNYKLWMEH